MWCFYSQRQYAEVFQLFSANLLVSFWRFEESFQFVCGWFEFLLIRSTHKIWSLRRSQLNGIPHSNNGGCAQQSTIQTSLVRITSFTAQVIKTSSLHLCYKWRKSKSFCLRLQMIRKNSHNTVYATSEEKKIILFEGDKVIKKHQSFHLCYKR